MDNKVEYSGLEPLTSTLPVSTVQVYDKLFSTNPNDQLIPKQLHKKKFLQAQKKAERMVSPLAPPVLT